MNPRAIEQIERGIAAIRELPLRERVPIDVKTVDEVRAYLREELEREYGPEELETLGKVYERLHLLPRETDLRAALVQLYGGQIAGFYDPREEKLFLVENAEVQSGGFLVDLLQLLLRRDLVGEMLLAHELTHALQDQHFDTLGRADDSSNDDRALAARAVLEGDATLAGFAYTLGGLSEGMVGTLVDRLQAVPAELAAVLPDTPPVLREALIFQYTEGARFVSWAYRRGGWAGVNAVLGSPPTSTEQILWPEKYYADPDGPTEVSLGGLEAYEKHGWTLVEENTFGALIVRVMTETSLDSVRASEVAKGWDGDRFAAFRKKDSLHVYWLSTWDTREDASEFADAMREILEAGRTASGAVGHAVERRDERVLVTVGVPAAELAKRAASIWKHSRFTPEAVTLPVDVAGASVLECMNTAMHRGRRAAPMALARLGSARCCSPARSALVRH